jgi:signal transduction histidine kinase
MSVGRIGDDVAVAVTNQGHSLTGDEIAYICERFHRTASAKLAGIEGTGLGLYITRSLVEAHGGRITAESTTAGVTTFRFTLLVATVC